MPPLDPEKGAPTPPGSSLPLGPSQEITGVGKAVTQPARVEGLGKLEEILKPVLSDPSQSHDCRPNGFGVLLWTHPASNHTQRYG